MRLCRMFGNLASLGGGFYCFVLCLVVQLACVWVGWASLHCCCEISWIGIIVNTPCELRERILDARLVATICLVVIMLKCVTISCGESSWIGITVNTL